MERTDVPRRCLMTDDFVAYLPASCVDAWSVFTAVLGLLRLLTYKGCMNLINQGCECWIVSLFVPWHYVLSGSQDLMVGLT